MLQSVFSQLNNSDPFADMRRMQSAMNHIFDGARVPGQSPTLPLVNFWASQDSIAMTTKLPGLNEKEIDISVSSDAMTIRGEKKIEHEEERKFAYMSGRSYGSFYRTLPLPAGVDTDKADATFWKGGLTVSLPKAAEALAKVKPIPVKAA